MALAIPSPVRRLAREPLVHFALIAFVIFAAHRAIHAGSEPADQPPADERIVIDDAFIDGLVEQERLASGRAPDRDEVERRWIRDERLAREAERQGLGAHDPILRRRMVQLGELWLEASVDVPEPTEEELAFVLERDAARYARPATLTFEHVFFQCRREDPAADARAAREALEGGDVEDAAALGDPFLLGATQSARTRAQVGSSFGPAFATAVFALEGEGWSAPIESSYGVHLVRPTARTEAAAPPLDEVRDRVRADWMAERTATEVRRAEERLRARYPVERR